METSDLLVAGPYERDATIQQPTNPFIHQSNNPSPTLPHPLLASANQELVFLTERYRGHAFGRQRRVEFHIAPDGAVRTSDSPRSTINPPFPTYDY